MAVDEFELHVEVLKASSFANNGDGIVSLSRRVFPRARFAVSVRKFRTRLAYFIGDFHCLRSRKF